MASNDVNFSIGVSINKNSVNEVKSQLKSLETEMEGLGTKYNNSLAMSKNSRKSDVLALRSEVKAAGKEFETFNKDLKAYDAQLDKVTEAENAYKQALKDRSNTQKRLNTAVAGLENTKRDYTTGTIDEDTYQAKKTSYEDKIKLETEKLKEQDAEVKNLKADYENTKTVAAGLESNLNESYNKIKQAEGAAQSLEDKFTTTSKSAEGTASATDKIDTATKNTASDAQKVQDAFKETSADANNTANATEGIEDAVKQVGNSAEGAKKVKDIFAEIRNTAVDSSSSIYEIVQKIAQLTHDEQDASAETELLMSKLNGFKTASADAAALQGHVDDIRDAMTYLRANSDRLHNMDEVFDSLSVSIAPAKAALSDLTSYWKKTGDAAVQTGQDIQNANIEGALSTINEISNDLATNGLPTNDIVKMAVYSSKLSSSFNTLKTAVATIPGLPASFKNSMSTAYSWITKLNRATIQYKQNAQNAGAQSQEFATEVQNGLNGVSTALSTVGSWWGVILSAITAVGSAISGFSSSTQSKFKSLTTSLVRYVLGFRNLFYLVRQLRTYVGEGIQNIVQWNDGDNEVNEAITDLLSSLLYLKNSWAAAFSPIITKVRPWLVSLIDKVAEVNNVIAKFVANLTGQSSVLLAVRVQAEDYADSLDDTSDSASSAADSVEEATDRLAAFDDLNVLGVDDDDSGSGGGSGIDEEDYTPDPNDMFELVETATDIGQQIKDAIENGFDFTDVGHTIAERLKEALEDVNSYWPEIQETAKNIGTAVGTFFNGFFGDTELFEEAGTTVAEALNTVSYALQSFFESYDFGTIALAFDTFLQSLFTDFDWSTAGQNLGNGLTMVFTEISTFLDNFPVDELFAGIQEFLEGINWEELIPAFFAFLTSSNNFISKIIEGIASLLRSIDVNELSTAISEVDWASWVDSIINVLISVGELEGSISSALMTLFAGIVSGISTYLTGQFLTDMNEAGLSGEFMGALQEMFNSALNDDPDAVAEGGVSAVNAIGETILAIIGKAYGYVTDKIYEKLEEWYGPLYEKILGYTPTELNEKNKELAENFLKGVGEGFSGMNETAWDLFGKPFFDMVYNMIDTNYEQIKAVGIYLIQGLEAGADEEVGTWSQWINEHIVQPMLTIVKKLFGIESPSTVFAEIGEYLIQGLMNGINSLIEDVKQIFEDLSTDILGKFDELKTQATQKWIMLKNAIVGKANEIKTKVEEKFGEVKDKVVEASENMRASALEKFIMLRTSIVTVFEKLNDLIKAPINSIIDTVESFVNKIIDGINSLTSGFTAVTDALGDTASSLNLPTISIGNIQHIDIPHLARGAVIPPNKEFMAVLGDQSSGTNIEAPLDTIKQAVAEELAEQLAVLEEGFASVVQAINNKNLSIGDKQIGQANARYVKQQNLIRGTNF